MAVQTYSKQTAKWITFLKFESENPKHHSKEKFISFAESCFVFSPRIALKGDYGLFIDGVSLEHLHKKLPLLCKQFGLRCREVGFGKTSFFALAHSRFKKQIPIEALPNFIQPFEIDEELETKTLEWITNLKLLGITTMSKLKDLPHNQLISRFGKEIIDAIRQFEGDQDLPWNYLHPTEEIEEKISVENYGNLDSILFILKIILDRICSRLIARGESATKLSLILKSEDKTIKKLELCLNFPQNQAKELLSLWKNLLFGKVNALNFQASIEEITLHVSEKMRWNGIQPQLFGSVEETNEAQNQLLERLIQKLGKDHVFYAQTIERHRPESSWTKTLQPKARKEPSATDFKSISPLRPLRVLRNPIPVHTNFLVLEGPERISGEWWQDPLFIGFDRDYYQVLTSKGEKLWVFKNRRELHSHNSKYYLHGFFD